MTALKQGEEISAIFGPLSCDGYASGGAKGRDGVLKILVGQCMGPMGYFDVAVIKRLDQPDEIIPIHMAETVQCL